MYFSLSKFFLYIIPLNIVIVSTSTLFPFIVGKYVWFRTSVDLALIFFLFGLLFNAEGRFYENRLQRIIKKPLVIAVIVFVFAFNVAGFFGFDPAQSFWSNFERGEGGFQILHFGLFFLLLVALLKNESDWRKMFYFSIAAALLMIVYGVLAMNGVSGFFSDIPSGMSFFEMLNYRAFRFSGSVGNPAYVASYLIFTMFYVAYIFISKQATKTLSLRRGILAILFLIFLAFFFLTGTRGAFVGVVAAIISLLFYIAFSNQKWRRSLLISILALIIAVTTMIFFKDEPFVKNIPAFRVFDISFSATTFRHRLIMWGIAIEGWKDRPLFGWGPENYYQVFDRHFNINYFKPSQGFGAWFDRAHNVFLDYLVETGIVGLLSYISIFAVFYWQLLHKTQINADLDPVQQQAVYGAGADKRRYVSENLRNNPRESVLQKALIFAVPIAYLVQGLMLFEVLSIYLNLFLFLAFATYYLYFKEEITNHKRQISNKF